MPEASEVFSHEILQRRVVENLLGQKLLQTAVLILERAETPGLRHVEAAVLGFPVVQRRRADPVPATQVRDPRARLVLLDDPNDLLSLNRLLRMTSVSSRRSTDSTSNRILLPGVRARFTYRDQVRLKLLEKTDTLKFASNKNMRLNGPYSRETGHYAVIYIVVIDLKIHKRCRKCSSLRNFPLAQLDQDFA